MDKMIVSSSEAELTVAKYIDLQITVCGKKQCDIANEAKFENPNIITMFKQGKTKLPLDKVGSIAKALIVDPVYLFRKVMSEYYPDTFRHIEDIFSQPILTRAEIELIEELRKRKFDQSQYCTLI